MRKDIEIDKNITEHFKHKNIQGIDLILGLIPLPGVAFVVPPPLPINITNSVYIDPSFSAREMRRKIQEKLQISPKTSITLQNNPNSISNTYTVLKNEYSKIPSHLFDIGENIIQIFLNKYPNLFSSTLIETAQRLSCSLPQNSNETIETIKHFGCKLRSQSKCKSRSNYSKYVSELQKLIESHNNVANCSEMASLAFGIAEENTTRKYMPEYGFDYVDYLTYNNGGHVALSIFEKSISKHRKNIRNRDSIIIDPWLGVVCNYDIWCQLCQKMFGLEKYKLD